MRKMADPLEGQEAVRSTPGPMAHSPEDIDLVMEAYLSAEPWRADPAVLRLPWTKDISLASVSHKFCFAIAYGDELVCDVAVVTYCS
jgi:amidase